MSDKKPPIPFKPESLESLRSRFPKALEKEWLISIENVILNNDRPGLRQDYVFDFESGLRLIISRETYVNHEYGTVIHVSASGTGPNKNIIIMEDIEFAYKALGGQGQLQFLGLSEGLIPHWFVYL